MNKILSIMRRDLTGVLQDNILTYIVLGPLLLALIVRFFIPAMENSTLNFAVAEGVQEEIAVALENYGSVERLNSENEVISRVERPDYTAGIVERDGILQLVLEGTEPRALVETFTIVLQSAAAGKEAAAVTFKSVAQPPLGWTAVAAVALMMSVVFLSGAVSGLIIVEEKDSRVVQALAVSPLKAWQLLAARGLFPLVVAVVISLLAARLAGFAPDSGTLLAAMLFSAPLVLLVALLMGGLAYNQIAAIAVIKVLMPVYMAVPLASLFVAERWHILFYPFPNYWQFQMLLHVFGAGLEHVAFWPAALLTLALGAVSLFVAGAAFRRKLRLH